MRPAEYRQTDRNRGKVREKEREREKEKKEKKSKEKHSNSVMRPKSRQESSQITSWDRQNFVMRPNFFCYETGQSPSDCPETYRQKEREREREREPENEKKRKKNS